MGLNFLLRASTITTQAATQIPCRRLTGGQGPRTRAQMSLSALSVGKSRSTPYTTWHGVRVNVNCSRWGKTGHDRVLSYSSFARLIAPLPPSTAGGGWERVADSQSRVSELQVPVWWRPSSLPVATPGSVGVHHSPWTFCADIQGYLQLEQ